MGMGMGAQVEAMTRCRYCQSGRIAVEPGSSLTYPCPDCRSVSTSQDSYGGVFVIDPRDGEDLDDFEPNESETKDT